MGVRLTSQEEVVALYDSVTGRAFGEVFDNEDDAEAFLEWLQPYDARQIDDLDKRRTEWEFTVRGAQP